MCFTRWILSGVSNIFYAAPEPMSGMAQVAKQLPSIWLQLIRDSDKKFGKADCSPELALFCHELFVLSQSAGGGRQWQWK